MAGKKKKKGRSHSGTSRRREEVPGDLGTLADAFGDRLAAVETSGAGPDSDERAEQARVERLRGLERVEADRRRYLRDNPEPERRKLTRDELMAEAFAAIDDADPAAKFLGTGYVAEDVDVVEEQRARPAPAPEAKTDDSMTSDDLLFVEMMAGTVNPLDQRDKYAALKEHAFSGIRWHDDVQLQSMTAEELHEPEITGSQRELLRRARKAAPIPVVNLRYLRRREALGDVEAFVRACVARGLRYARIVHGKGRQSEGDPVLKPAIVNWCRHEGASMVRYWAPETDLSGQFGSIVIELHRSGA